MESQDIVTQQANNGSIAIVAILLFFTAFFALFARSWNKLGRYFKTSEKIIGKRSDYHKTVVIDGQKFTNCFAIPVDSGLYLECTSIPLRFFIKRIFIPWISFNTIKHKEINILGIGFDDYILEVRTPLGDVKLDINKKIVSEIIEKKYLKYNTTENSV